MKKESVDVKKSAVGIELRMAKPIPPPHRKYAPLPVKRAYGQDGLTIVQESVLEFIIQQIEERRLPPTHREIGKHFGWNSNAAAKCHILALEKKGFIRTILRISRGIKLKPTAHEWAANRAGRLRD